MNEEGSAVPSVGPVLLGKGGCRERQGHAVLFQGICHTNNTV